MSPAQKWLAPVAALLIAAGCAEPSAPDVAPAPQLSLMAGPTAVHAALAARTTAPVRGLAASGPTLELVTSSAALTAFGTRAEFNGRTVQQTETFAQFGGQTMMLPTPYTTSGVTYATRANVLINKDADFGNAGPVVCYNELTPMIGQIGGEAAHYTLFGFDLSVLVNEEPVNIALTTNRTTYNFDRVAAGGAANPGFFGFATTDPDEYFTGFTISSSGRGAPCLGNISVGSAVPLDATAPVIVPTLTGTMGMDGWYTSDVALSWSVTDPESPVSSTTGCNAVTVTADQDATTYTCGATSLGGSGTASVTIKRDATAPAVAFSGNAGHYTIVDQVSITCSATDNLSGIASSTCAPVSGAAYTFGTGTTTRTATATDKAGNTGSASTSFSVTADAASLCTLVGRWSSSEGVTNSLCAKISAGDIAAFRNEVSAQSGKKISARHASILLKLVASM